MKKQLTIEKEMKPVIGILSTLIVIIAIAFALVLSTGCTTPKYGCRGNYHMSGFHPKNK